MSSIYKKLMAARVAFNAIPLKKSGLNKFAGYSYFQLADFLPQAQQTFNDIGLCGVISYGLEIATLTIYDMDTDQKIEITSPMAEANLKGSHPIQNLGAVETYTRRYLWMTALELVEHDAIDSSEPVNDKGIKPAKGVNKPTDGAWDNMNPEEQESVQTVAMVVMGYAEDNQIADAFIALEDYCGLDNDLKIAVWSRLPSNVRSAIKKHQELLKGK